MRASRGPTALTAYAKTCSSLRARASRTTICSLCAKESCRSEVDIASLLDLYNKVRCHRPVKDDDTNPLVSILKLSGVTRVVDGCLKVRNRIYSTVFDSNWVKENMPDADLRRQRAAFRRGVYRATAVAVVIIVALISGFSAFVAFKQRNLAKAEAEHDEQHCRSVEQDE